MMSEEEGIQKIINSREELAIEEDKVKRPTRRVEWQ